MPPFILPVRYPRICVIKPPSSPSPPLSLPLLPPPLLLQVDAVNQLFGEARDEIEFAKEEAETVYFNESVQEARKAVEACMSRWEALLAALPEEERNRVVRTMGLKMAQLQVREAGGRDGCAAA
jgi:hypothetical protein